MKTLLSLFLLAAFARPVLGQLSVKDLLASEEVHQPVYVPVSTVDKQLRLEMSYGSADFRSISEKSLKGASIAAVDIVYSDFPKGAGFSKLNMQRLENLLKLYPELSKSKRITWRFVRQTGCKDLASARALFHGIVISYRPVQSAAETTREVRYLEDILRLPKAEGTFKEVPATASRSHMQEMVPVLGKDRFVYSPVMQDSTVFNVLSRNKWSKMAITADLTGSMSPYTAQLLLWLRLNTNDSKVKQFVFFNDGDGKPDHHKVIGSTGGIYSLRSLSFDEVNRMAVKVMRNGCGGDSPENNIEALLKTAELCPDCSQYIMIADNWAMVKDISLLHLVKKPVRIILCGAHYGINTQYLDIARATGGSIHTMEADLTDLIKLHEGDEIVLGPQKFRIVEGVFTLVRDI